MPTMQVEPPKPDDRFQVTTIDGWTIHSPGNRASYGYSFSVIDTCNADRELGRFYAGAHHLRPKRPSGFVPLTSFELRRAAYVFAEKLNRAERKHEAQFDDNVFD